MFSSAAEKKSLTYDLCQYVYLDAVSLAKTIQLQCMYEYVQLFFEAENAQRFSFLGMCMFSCFHF